MAKKLVQDGSCPVATTISLLNSQWKILIMRELLLHPSERYSELQHSVAGISQKMLTQSLHEMTADGIVQRQVFPEVPPRVEYAGRINSRKLILHKNDHSQKTLCLNL